MLFSIRIAKRATRFGLAMVAVLSVAMAQASDANTAAYLTARDKAVADFKNVTETGPAIDSRHNAALRRLQAMLKAIIEPVRLDGFASSGKYNIDTLFQELGYGKLDAIVVNATNGKSKAVVSTVPLVEAWLKSNPDVLKHPHGSSAKDIAEAFASEDFYTYAISSDAHYYQYAALPVTPSSASDRVYALLYSAGQDETAPSPPDGLAVAVMRGDRVVIFDEPVVAPDSPACRASYKADMAKTEAVWAEYRASKLADATKADKAQAMEDKASRDFYRCYAHYVPSTAAYAALVCEAQGLVDKVQ